MRRLLSRLAAFALCGLPLPTFAQDANSADVKTVVRSDDQSTPGGTAAAARSAIRPSKSSIRLEPVEGTPYFVDDFSILEQGIETSEGTVVWEDLQAIDLYPPDAYGDNGLVLLEVGGVGARDISEASIKLDRGMHRFHLGYVHRPGEAASLDLEIKGPALPNWQSIPSAMIYNAKDGKFKREWNSKGFDDEGHRLADKVPSIQSGASGRMLGAPRGNRTPQRIEDIRDLVILGYESKKELSPPDKPRSETFGQVVGGLLRIPKKGEYAFRLKTSGMARLYFGDWPPGIADRTKAVRDDEWEFELASEGRLVGLLAGIDEETATCHYLAGSPFNRRETPVPLARGYVQSIWRSGHFGGGGIERLTGAGGRDVVYAVGNGAAIRGVPGRVVGLRDDRLVFEFGGEERTIALEKVRGITFAAEPLAPGQPGDVWLVARLVGDSELPCTIDGGRIDKTRLTLPGGTEVLLGYDEVQGYEVIGGRIVSLTQLPPSAKKKTPLFDLPPSIIRDRTPEDKPLRLDRRTVQDGWCMTSQSELQFDLSKRFGEFRCRVGLVDGAAGPCDIIVLGDGRELHAIRGATDKTNEKLSIAVDDVSTLALRVEFGDGSDAGDIVVWAAPELIRASSNQP